MATISTETTYKFYTVSFNGETIFSYDFMLLDASHLDVYINGVPRTDWTVTGVGSGNGTLVFLGSSALVAGNTLFFRRNTPETQLTDFEDHDMFLMDTLEDTFGKLTLLVQELKEELSRRPALAIHVANVLRGLFFPTPVPLKLWGWDALGTNITYYDPLILPVFPGLSAHMTVGESIVVVPTVDGEVQLTSGTVFPPGCIRIGAIVRVTTTFGNSLGLTTFSAGSPDTIDRWGSGLARTATAAPVGGNNAGMFVDFQWKPMVSGEAVVLTADSGQFDSTGSATITGVYATLGAAYDPAIPPGLPDLSTHMTIEESIVVVPAVGLQVQLTSGTVFPPGCIRIGAIVRVTTTFGNSLGLSTFSAGSPDTIDRWGSGLARTDTVAPFGANNAGMFVDFQWKPIVGGEPVVLTADAGQFDAAGSITITGIYAILTAA